MLLSVNYHIKKVFAHCFLFITIVAVDVSELPFAKSDFVMDHPAGASEKYPQVCAEQTKRLLRTHPGSGFCPRGRTKSDFIRCTSSTSKRILSATRKLKFF